jgi:hypothetical protein
VIRTLLAANTVRPEEPLSPGQSDPWVPVAKLTLSQTYMMIWGSHWLSIIRYLFGVISQALKAVCVSLASLTGGFQTPHHQSCVPISPGLCFALAQTRCSVTGLQYLFSAILVLIYPTLRLFVNNLLDSVINRGSQARLPPTLLVITRPVTGYKLLVEITLNYYFLQYHPFQASCWEMHILDVKKHIMCA